MSIEKLIINNKEYYTSESIVYLLEDISDLNECIQEQQAYIDEILEEKAKLYRVYRELINEKTSKMDSSGCYHCKRNPNCS